MRSTPSVAPRPGCTGTAPASSRPVSRTSSRGSANCTELGPAQRARPCAQRGSAGGVEQSADRNLCGQLVVELHGLPGFQDVYRYAVLVQVGQGGGVDV